MLELEVEMNKQFYAGIGARATPPEMLKLMTDVADILGRQGYILRSGGAKGADTAFYEGAKRSNSPYRIYLPSQSFNGFRANPSQGFLDASTSPNWSKAMETVAKYHPAPERLSSFAKALQARNAYQMLGATMDNPASMVVAWTPRGEVTGGTGQALRMAKDYGIPTYNLAIDKERDQILDLIF